MSSKEISLDGNRPSAQANKELFDLGAQLVATHFDQVEQLSCFLSPVGLLGDADLGFAHGWHLFDNDRRLFAFHLQALPLRRQFNTKSATTSIWIWPTV